MLCFDVAYFYVFLREGVKVMLSDLLYFFLPQTCYVCGRHLSVSEQKICSDCFSQLPRTLYHRIEKNPMEQRFAGFFPFEKASALFFYTPNSAVASLIHDFKYRKFPFLAEYLGLKIGEELFASGFFSDIDLILPIPMHWWKKMMRGYNQVDYLAKGLGEVVSLPVGNQLRMRRRHKTQTTLSHEQRLRNTEQLFEVRNSGSLEGKHILLIDDVCTTGATLRSAAECIIKSVKDVRITIFALAVT